MPKPRKTWREKLLDDKDLPKVSVIEGELSKRWGEGTVVIPAPREVDEIMQAVPKGRLITTKEIQAAIAKKHNAVMACPMCCGIFAWIAAHAADEAESAGAKRVTPYWRTLKSSGELNPKFPGGVAALKVRLEAEGHRIVSKDNPKTRSGSLRIMRVVWFLAARAVERSPAVRQAQRPNLQNLPVEADRRRGEEFLECDGVRRLGL